MPQKLVINSDYYNDGLYQPVEVDCTSLQKWTVQINLLTNAKVSF